MYCSRVVALCHHPFFFVYPRQNKNRCSLSQYSLVYPCKVKRQTEFNSTYSGPRMFSRLKELYQFVDNTVEEITKQFPDQVRCKPGCADCCHAVFDISFIEAAYLARFLKSHEDIRQSQQQRGQSAAVAFEKLLKEDADLAKARIRCPLLGEDNLCLGHNVRPINCRTYGTPTVIDGKAHVCGVSEFDNKKSYPTIDLEPLQKSLYNYSVELVGEEFGRRRYPIAWVLLKTDFFLPPEQE